MTTREKLLKIKQVRRVYGDTEGDGTFTIDTNSLYIYPKARDKSKTRRRQGQFRITFEKAKKRGGIRPVRVQKIGSRATVIKNQRWYNNEKVALIPTHPHIGPRIENRGPVNIFAGNSCIGGIRKGLKKAAASQDKELMVFSILQSLEVYTPTDVFWDLEIVSKSWGPEEPNPYYRPKRKKKKVKVF